MDSYLRQGLRGITEQDERQNFGDVVQGQIVHDQRGLRVRQPNLGKAGPDMPGDEYGDGYARAARAGGEQLRRLYPEPPEPGQPVQPHLQPQPPQINPAAIAQHANTPLNQRVYYRPMPRSQDPGPAAPAPSPLHASIGQAIMRGLQSVFARDPNRPNPLIGRDAQLGIDPGTGPTTTPLTRGLRDMGWTSTPVTRAVGRFVSNQFPSDPNRPNPLIGRDAQLAQPAAAAPATPPPNPGAPAPLRSAPPPAAAPAGLRTPSADIAASADRFPPMPDLGTTGTPAAENTPAARPGAATRAPWNSHTILEDGREMFTRGRTAVTFSPEELAEADKLPGGRQSYIHSALSGRLPGAEQLRRGTYDPENDTAVQAGRDFQGRGYTGNNRRGGVSRSQAGDAAFNRPDTMRFGIQDQREDTARRLEERARRAADLADRTSDERNASAGVRDYAPNSTAGRAQDRRATRMEGLRERGLDRQRDVDVARAYGEGKAAGRPVQEIEGMDEQELKDHGIAYRRNKTGGFDPLDQKAASETMARNAEMVDAVNALPDDQVDLANNGKEVRNWLGRSTNERKKMALVVDRNGAGLTVIDREALAKGETLKDKSPRYTELNPSAPIVRRALAERGFKAFAEKGGAGAPRAPSAPQTLPTVATQADFDKLPPGATYLTPKGARRMKPETKA